MNIAVPRNTYTPVLKRRYAHTIGFLPERDLLCVHCHAVSDQIFCAQALPTRKKHKHRRAQRVLKKTLRIPSGKRGARPRSGRFFRIHRVQYDFRGPKRAQNFVRVDVSSHFNQKLSPKAQFFFKAGPPPDSQNCHRRRMFLRCFG